MLKKGFLRFIMKRLYKSKLITPEKEDKAYFVEMIIFVILMILAIAVIFYLGITFYQSNMEKVPAQLFP